MRSESGTIRCRIEFYTQLNLDLSQLKCVSESGQELLEYSANFTYVIHIGMRLLFYRYFDLIFEVVDY